MADYMSRIQFMKNRVVNVTPEMDLENARIMTESFKETEGEPLAIRKAKAFRKQCREKTVKIWDSELHRKWVGVPNDLIKENFRRLDKSYHGDIHVRIPVIPGINMNEDNMVKTAEFFRWTRCTADIELLAYHRLGTDTYRKLGLEYELADTGTPSSAEMAEMADVILRTDPDRVVLINGDVYRP